MLDLGFRISGYLGLYTKVWGPGLRISGQLGFIQRLGVQGLGFLV